MENRRKHTRVPLMTVARITPHGLQNTVDALVHDVSREGMGVYVKGPYQKGDILLVKISVKTEEGEAINESLYGRVAWATRLESRRPICHRS
ncbi:MAG: PilZ domain-containing protein [Candidatus Manganitrophus sp.]|nr:PilZ domain-containing protein [Candidatus Manganitrophus sp.]